MNKTIFNFLCAILIGFIIITGIILTNIATPATAIALGILGAIFAFAFFLPAISSRVKHICCDLDWADEITTLYQHIPPLYRKSFWLLFAFINIAFLFHTINFMWGASDWAAVRTAVNTNESLADGRFSAFFLQNLLFNGKILPVINNLWAFAGLSLAGVLLAMYWQLPKKTSTYVISGLLLSVSPYTMSWLYSAKNTLGIMWLPAFSLGGLMLAELKMQSSNRTLAKNLISVILFLLALGTFFPIINFIAVAILGKIFLQTTSADIKLKVAAQRCLQSFANITAAAMLYLLVLSILNETGIWENSYSLLTIFTSYWTNIPTLIKMMISQFITPLPFTDLGYQLLSLVLLIAGIFAIIFKTPNIKTALRGLLLILLILAASKASILFTINQEETTANLAQLNFFSLPIVYTLMFALLVKLGGAYTRRGTYCLSMLLIFMSFVRVTYAQKVWKFGWDAETKLAERIITRLEKLPEFDVNHQYKLLQIGEMSLRGKYYLKKSHEQPNNNLLQKSYYPANMSKDAYNFFYQTDFVNENISIETAIEEPAIREYLLTRARPWPAQESLWIYGDYIIMIIDEQSLIKAQRALQN